MKKGLGILFALAALPALAQPDLSKVEIEATKLSDSAWLLVGAGGNIGLSVGNDGVVMIDDQFAPLTPKIQAAVAKISPKPVKFLINTHWHFDHTGGNENFGGTGAVIVAHENVRKRMSTDGAIQFLKMDFKASPAAALPVITFTRDAAFHLNGEDLSILHAPAAHTDGDAIVRFTKSNVIHMGDTFFNKLYPFIDYSSGGSAQGVVAAADRVLKIADDNTKIIPGHGPLATKADLKTYRDMMATISKRVGDQVKSGKTLKQVLASKPTKEYDAQWGKGFLDPERFVTMLYEGMRKK